MSEKKSTYKGFTPARAEANKRYLDKFVNIIARVSPKKKSEIQKHAETQGESLNAFVIRAIEETMERDTKKD